MTRSLLVAALALCAGVGLVPAPPVAAQPAPAPGGGDGELVNKVKDAIDRGVAYLRKNQAKDGSWEGGFFLKTLADMDGGPTALAVLALLNSGVPVDDPAVKGGIEYLRKRTPRKTYAVALQTMALSEAQLLSRDKKDQSKLNANAEWLARIAIRTGGKLQGWSYPSRPESAVGDIPDNSNTQYALLGLYAAKVAGVKIEDSLWKEIQDFYTRTQKPDQSNQKAGFWVYSSLDQNKPSFTMSVGGACGLIIANLGLDKSEQQLNPDTGVAARCGAYSDNDALAKGMNYIGTNFAFDQGMSYFYNYYGIERLGRLSGQRFIGRMDWYREGCVRLLRLQQPDGAFVYTSNTSGLDKPYPVVTTAFALLYLSKGRTPVLVSKFAWGNFVRGEVGKSDQAILTERDPGGNATGTPNWNRKHNDCRNVVEFAQREIFEGAPLSWQVYDMRLQNLTSQDRIDSEVGLLLQSPLVYLNGHGPMPFVTRSTDPALHVAEQILKRYVEEGGFLFAEACCGDRDFASSFESLVDRIFPGSQLKKVPPDHAIWQMFPGVSPEDFPDLMYLDRGCRTVAVFSPSPLAGYWEERRFIPADGRDPKNRGEKAFCLSRNVIAYATGMELPKPKLTKTTIVTPDKGIARSKFRALQLKYVSDASVQQPPASDALRNLMSYLGQNAKLDVALTSEVLQPSDPKLTRYKFMYLHGRKPIQFTPDEADNVKVNLQTGGLLLVDAACNDIKQWRAFDKSFRDSMAKMFPDQKLTTIPFANEPLFDLAKQSGLNLGSVKCRRENAEGTGAERELRNYPVLLEGIKIDEQIVDGKKVGGRWAVIYSKYDIGCAIEGHKSAECLGHDKESALRIASAIALYSLRR
ncbi:DUF4159 domain-containing protein [Gemmata sp. JC673]|uniref:DUF4159 domain-containing protein n=1 Tax=Gemmata algarum TaxID=2975278 RepID=A0ABU5F4U2_9BACT|nr:DUF4159 domain-containing protein [Gemmata algarum]MDY3562600.1 DUF4159 domain-containing protein [Gemmata algarum]